MENFPVSSQALCNELSDTGVAVTALMPVPTETNFFNRAGLTSTEVEVARFLEAERSPHQGEAS